MEGERGREGEGGRGKEGGGGREGGRVRAGAAYCALSAAQHVHTSPPVASDLRVECLQYGHNSGVSRSEEWLAPGFFIPQAGGGVSVEGRETVPNPFPIVPQARRPRTVGLGVAARTAMLARAPQSGPRRRQRPGSFLSQLAAATEHEYALEGQAVSADAMPDSRFDLG
jgi:hypothetical protein